MQTVQTVWLYGYRLLTASIMSPPTESHRVNMSFHMAVQYIAPSISSHRRHAEFGVIVAQMGSSQPSDGVIPLHRLAGLDAPG
jgi:hypothetical protein